jgi:acetyl-CoA C-acetyltransferase
MMHSLATMLDRLRADPGSVGMVTGVGMHMTKHVFGVYSAAPPPQGRVRSPAAEAVQAKLDAIPSTAIVDQHTGPATVATYTVVHARTGEPEWGLVIADVGDGTRAYGRVEDIDLLHALETDEWVGRQVELDARDDGVNLVRAG